MKKETEERLREDLNSMKDEVAAIDEIVAPLLEKRRKLRHKINVAECRLQRAGKEK